MELLTPATAAGKRAGIICVDGCGVNLFLARRPESRAARPIRPDPNPPTAHGARKKIAGDERFVRLVAHYALKGEAGLPVRLAGSSEMERSEDEKHFED